MVDWKIKTLLHFFTTLRLFANAPHLPVVKLLHAYNLQRSKTLAASKDPIHTKTFSRFKSKHFLTTKCKYPKNRSHDNIYRWRTKEGFAKVRTPFLSIVNTQHIGQLNAFQSILQIICSCELNFAVHFTIHWAQIATHDELILSSIGEKD